jgi:uncharacterized protein YneF (UPF0154 family)
MSKFILYTSILLSLVLGLQIGAYYMRDITVIYCNENPTICQQEYKNTKSQYPNLNFTVEAPTIGQEKPKVNVNLIDTK